MSASPTTARQEELLDLALEIARESGLSGLTVRRLAERAGFSEAALYRHYPSKEALLLALMARMEERFLSIIEAIAGDTRRPAAERLRQVVRTHVRAVIEIDGLPVLLVAEAAASEHAALRARLQRTLRRYLGVLEKLVAALPPDAARPRPAEASLLLLGLSAASAVRHRVLPDPELERRASDQVADWLVDRLVGASAARPPADDSRSDTP